MTRKFQHPETKEIEYFCELSSKQLEDCRSLITYLVNKGIDFEDSKNLMSLLMMVEKNLAALSSHLISISIPLHALDEKIMTSRQVEPGAVGRQPKYISSFQYQEKEAALIEKEFMKSRVREIHFRHLPIRTLKASSDGCVVLMAYSIKNDEPVELLKIPKLYDDFEQLDKIINSMDALKELTFSRYFQKFLGSNAICDLDYIYFFFEHLQGAKSLVSLLAERRLTPDDILFKYWMRELLNGLTDFWEQSTYTFTKPIKIENIYIMNEGLKVLFRNVEMGKKRSSPLDSNESLECRLLKIFGKLLIKMLGCIPFLYLF